MQNNINTQAQPTVSSVVTASGSRNGQIPPIVITTLANELFADDYSTNDVLSSFDYEAFLRKEGLA